MTSHNPLRPLSDMSIISPHAALEALVGDAGIDIRDSLDPQLGNYANQSGYGTETLGESSGTSADDDNGDDDGDDEGGIQERLFVRAKFNFNAQDPSALSFQAGDIIEVYTRLESGWWDGMLDGQRGWFPSNFVEVVSPDEMGIPDIAGVAGVRTEEADPKVHNRNPHNPQEAHQSPSHRNPNPEQEFRQEVGGDEWNQDQALEHLQQQQQQLHTDQTYGLDDLAREVMGLNTDDDVGGIPDDVDEFELAAVERRRKQNQALMESQARQNDFGLASGDMEVGGMDEFGVPKRQREETGETIKALGPNLIATERGHAEREVEHPAQIAGGSQDVDQDEGRDMADEHHWVPTLTPDGQIYYHNPVTGEDSWELPPTTPPSDTKELWENDDEDLFHSTSLTGLSSSAYANTSENALGTPDSHNDSFRPPPKMQNELPHPWIARLSDDGRQWFYVNKFTGATRRDPPASGDMDVQANRLSTGSSSKIMPIRASRPKIRHSVEVRRKGVDEWTNRTRQQLKEVLKPERPHDMGWHMDVVNDALREVFEAAVAGSAAEEELSRAADLGSREGVDAALIREEIAVEMLKSSYTALLAIIRSLLSAFGYVGPLDGMVEMPRPGWTADMSLVGAIGILSNHVHAAVASKRLRDSGENTWPDVMRAASKLKDTISLFPTYVTPDQTQNIQEGAIGKATTAVLGIDGPGEILGRRWGFGTPVEHPGDVPFSPTHPPLRALDSAYLGELVRAKEEFERIQPTPDSIIYTIRAASRFKALSLAVDIASAVDVDGDMSDRTREEDARVYGELLADVQNALLDLEEATASIDELSIFLLHAMDSHDRAYQSLCQTITMSFNAITSLHQLSGQQQALAERGNLKAQIGWRSSKFVPRKTSARPQSLMSDQSRGSRRSAPVVRGLEEEFMEQHGNSIDYENESRDHPSDLNSANASQTSLVQHQQQQRRNVGHGHAGDMSATSSTTSLAYQQTENSDSGSVRGKRNSLMKFIKGRSSQDDDGRGTSRSNKASSSRKLAKLLGEDYASLPTVPPPSSSMPNPMPETPWYLGEDYTPEDCTFDDKGMVKAATLPALIARLTPHGQTDTAFFQAFLLTFRSFTNGPELLELLIQRYNIPPPEGLTEAEMQDWKAKKQTPIRLRVANTMRTWLDNHYQEAEDHIVLDPIDKFAKETLLANGSELLSKQLCSMVQRRRQGDGEAPRRIISGSLLSPPAPLLPRTIPGRPIKLTDIAPVELARQLTILESGHFQKIGAAECMNKIWNQGKNPQDTPNISQIIRLANIISSWVAACVLASKDVKQRAAVIKYFIQTAIELRTMNNFSSMASIMAGVNSAPILRLKRTHELLSGKTNVHKADLERTMDSTKNFSNYKEMLKTINPPCVPFFGFWLSALTFIEDGNRNIIKPGQSRSNTGLPTSSSANSLSSRANAPPSASGSGPTGAAAQAAAAASATASSGPTTDQPANAKPLINFYKRHLAAEILRDVKQYQSQPYNLAKCKPVAEWMDKQFVITEKTGQDMTTLYDLSLQLEPREREEERITRMLHDSGTMDEIRVMSRMTVPANNDFCASEAPDDDQLQYDLDKLQLDEITKEGP